MELQSADHAASEIGADQGLEDRERVAHRGIQIVGRDDHPVPELGRLQGRRPDHGPREIE